MRAHSLQHVPFEGLGSIEPWLEANGYALTHTRFFASTDLPVPEVIDLLIVMGGPMSVHDTADFPWLGLEKAFVREVIEAGKPILGICLGAQIIANVLGAKVFPNQQKEIGWFPIHAIPSSEDSVFSFPPSETVFHWHGETFDLPPGAIRLARSDGCENQAFQLDKRIIGLQFHLETTPESARELISHCRDELIPSRFVQSEEEILSAGPDRYTSINDLMSSVLAFLHRG